MMPNDDQRIRQAIPMERAGSTQVLPGQQDDPAADDHRGGGKRVAQLVNEGAADVYVMRGAEQHPGNGAVHQHANHGHPDHDARMDRDRVPHPKKGFIENVKGDCHQREGVDEGSQHSGAMVAKSLGGAGRAGLDENRDP